MMRALILMMAVFMGSVNAEEKREHYYTINDGYDYAYELKSGPKLFSIIYLGEKEGAYQIVDTNGIDAIIYQADKNGSFAKVFKYKRNTFRGSSMLKLNPNMAVTQAFLDAWNGRLKQFVDNKGRYTWVDGRKGKVKTVANH